MDTNNDDAFTALLERLLKENPDASDDEMWELFSQAARGNDEVNAAIEKLYLNQVRLN